MSATLVDKLLQSFDKLDSCITLTRQVLTERTDVPENVIRRIDSYSEIVEKQRSLAGELREHIAERNWAEVSRHVRLINGFSSMIREDAKAILSGQYGEQSVSADSGSLT